MKKLSIVLIVTLLLGLCSCSSKPDLIGEWNLREESRKVSNFNDYYPEGDSLIFNDDETWSCGTDGTYNVSGNTITMDGDDLVCQYTYTFSVENDVLRLEYQGQEPIFYDRAD